MKRIVFVTNSMGFGGAEKMITFVANSLCDRGHPCCIVNLNAIGDYINEKQQFVHKEIAVYTLKKVKGEHDRHKYRIVELYHIAKDFKADILIGFTGYPGFYARIVGYLLNIPSIMSERGDPTKTTPRTLKSKLFLAVLNTSKGGVFQLEGAKSFYGRKLQRRSTVIPNPIFIKDDIPEVPFERRGKTVVSVGRLDNEQKRYDVMIQAFQLFSKTHPEYTLKIYGRGEDEDQIKKWVNEAGLEEKVKYMGVSQKPMQDIASDGIFLITSDYEGISNALLEAMAVGLPCVSTDHTPGGARLLISDRENGLLTPTGDYAGIAEALCEFAEKPDFARKCGRNAKNVITRFDPDRIIDKWEEYIEKI